MSTPGFLLPSKVVMETKTYDFPFTLPVGATITSQACSVETYSGIDASPSSLISGSCTASGSTVSQKLTAGTAGVTYLVTATATLSDGQVLQLAGLLAVVPRQAG